MSLPIPEVSIFSSLPSTEVSIYFFITKFLKTDVQLELISKGNGGLMESYLPITAEYQEFAEAISSVYTRYVVPVSILKVTFFMVMEQLLKCL